MGHVILTTPILGCFQAALASVGWDFLWPAYMSIYQTSRLYLHPLRKWVRMVTENGMVWGSYGSHKVIRQSAYELYSNYVPILHRFWETKRDIGWKSPISTYTTCICRPRWEWPVGISQDLWHQKLLEFLWCVMGLFASWHVYSRSDTTPNCSGQTDRRTNTGP